MPPVIKLWTDPFSASTSEVREHSSSACRKTATSTGAKLSSVVERLWKTKQQCAPMAVVNGRDEGPKQRALGRTNDPKKTLERNVTPVPPKSPKPVAKALRPIADPSARRNEPPLKHTEKITSTVKAEQVAGGKATRKAAPSQEEGAPASKESSSKPQANIIRKRRRKVMSHEEAAERKRRLRLQKEAQVKKSLRAADGQTRSGSGGTNEPGAMRTATGKALQEPLKNVSEVTSAQKTGHRPSNPSIAPSEAAPASPPHVGDDEPLILTESDLAELGFLECEVFIERMPNEEMPEPSACEDGDLGRKSDGMGHGDTALRQLSTRERRIPKRFGEYDVDKRLERTGGKCSAEGATGSAQENPADWDMPDFEIVIEPTPDGLLQLTEEQVRALNEISLALSEIIEPDLECMVTAWVELGMTAKSMGVSEFSLPKIWARQ